MNKKIVGVILLFCFSMHYEYLYAQQKSISIQNIAEVKVDNLSDDQVKQFIAEYKSNGYSLNQVERLAAQRKMPQDEIQKLLARIQKIEQKTGNTEQSFDRKLSNESELVNDKSTEVFKSLEKVVFGAELFNNKNLTFEPNLKIPTPSNYQLGPDDELIIDIYGYSEATYKLKVTPDGALRIPSIGPIQVSGNTIEQARKKITARLETIYSGISTGQTFVNITLGTIRSIKVVILGDVNLPGTYTMSSLATVFNALYASGGPNKNGSFRNIKVIRGGKVIAIVDVYEFLLKGETKNNIRLNDQDVIKVSPYENKIELIGEVKRPAYYEVAKNETLKDVINFAGGFTNEAYKDRIKVTRNTLKERSIADVPNEMFGMFTPQSGDVFEVGSISDRFNNRITISGAVFRPGEYALEEGITASKLIKKADGLKEDAFTSRAIIYRLKEDNTAEVISFDVAEALSGTKDIALKREDFIVINSKLDMMEKHTITIQGEVLKPGNFPFASNTKVEDLIVAAGGLKENAALKKIEIARRYFNEGLKSESEIAKIILYEVNDSLRATSDIELMPYDIVTVYAIPGYTAQQNVFLEGEVQYPGQYTISNKAERISDIIKRSGGVTQYGFLKGAVLIRTRQLNDAEKKIREGRINAIKKQTKDTAIVQDLIDKELGSLTSIVGINMEKILKYPGSKYDLLLANGDLISIPGQRQTVKVSGEVLYPISIPYDKGRGFSSYVNGAGGYSERALKRRGYVVFLNGSVKSTKSFLGIKSHPRIQPGAEIIIPPREERKKLTGVELITITTSITTLAILVVSLFR